MAVILDDLPLTPNQKVWAQLLIDYGEEEAPSEPIPAVTYAQTKRVRERVAEMQVLLENIMQGLRKLQQVYRNQRDADFETSHP